jgi:hypothetical protein
MCGRVSWYDSFSSGVPVEGRTWLRYSQPEFNPRLSA